MRSHQHKLATLACLFMLPVAANAQSAISPTIDGVFSISKSSLEAFGDESETEGFFLSSDLTFSDHISLGLDVDRKTWDPDFTLIDLSFDRLQLEPTYTFANGFYVGAFVQDASLDVIYSIDFDSRGLFAGFTSGKWDAEVYVGETEMSLGPFGEGQSESTMHGVSTSYDISDQLEISAHISQANLPDDSGGGQHNMHALAATYKLNNGYTAYGAYERFKSEMYGAEEFDAYALGVGYNFAERGTNVPGMVTIEVGRRDIYDSSEDWTTLAWVVPLGKGEVEPLDSIARSAKGDVRTPYLQFVAHSSGLTVLP